MPSPMSVRPVTVSGREGEGREERSMKGEKAKDRNITKKNGEGMSYEKKYMDRAVALALENIDQGGGPFGCVIVKDGEIVSEGVNRVTSRHDPTSHAEVNAIRLACEKLGTYRLDGCELYASCEPCPMCLGAIYWSHVSALYYASSREDAEGAGFDDALIYRELCTEVGERLLPTSRHPMRKADDVFLKWKKTTDKTEY